MNNIVVIRRKLDSGKHAGTMVAAIENPDNCMSPAAVALAYCRGEGYEDIPHWYEYHEVPLTSFGVVLRKITPCFELEKLEADAKKQG